MTEGLKIVVLVFQQFFLYIFLSCWQFRGLGNFLIKYDTVSHNFHFQLKSPISPECLSDNISWQCFRRGGIQVLIPYMEKKLPYIIIFFIKDLF